MSTSRAIVRLAVALAWTLPLMPLQWGLNRAGHALGDWLPVLYHRGLCRILGLRVVHRGTAERGGPTLFVANHTSWIDIAVLSTFVPVSFIAKHEVAGWPFFGTLARLQRTVFVERRAVRTADNRDDIARRLEQGHSLLLFPEGTSNDGNRVLPFKSAFFAAAATEVDGRPVKVQPLSIAYTQLDGLPVGRRLRPLYAWYGDMELVPHLWRVLKLGRTEVEVEFHPPVHLDEFGDRKRLAAHCHRTIASSLARAIAGRREPLPAVAAARDPAADAA